MKIPIFVLLVLQIVMLMNVSHADEAMDGVAEPSCTLDLLGDFLLQKDSTGQLKLSGCQKEGPVDFQLPVIKVSISGAVSDELVIVSQGEYKKSSEYSFIISDVVNSRMELDVGLAKSGDTVYENNVAFFELDYM
ncbi:hypothetical protein [Aeromonas cavernicola]|uniref:Uncharacterized protein n=1 Tax=Aeromonas cavernicola TaxID=1006623 RepID=A0A2H9U6P4_9GAMM|nr:hypothetical protein [Aeromonas cavernicola]PJG59649.1 hypothetical protein CUC53_06075 [Aeromonas cavernicola]